MAVSAIPTPAGSKKMIRFRQTGAARWLVLAVVATGTVAALGAGLTWSAAPADPHAGFLDITPDGTQPGLASAMEPNTGCFGCHRSFNPDSPQATFMPHNTWGGSMMAHSGRDPLFWAALDVANADLPGAGDWCLRCHAPTAWLEGRVLKTPGGGVVDGTDGCLLEGRHDATDDKGNDYAGIGCHFCHRMTETGPAGETAPPGSGNFWLDDALSCETPGGTYGGPCRAGPYHYQPGDLFEPPHGWVYSAFLDRGAVCGVCHDVTSPITANGPLRTLILPDGTDTGMAMPIERTFTEWGRSDFGDLVFRDRMGDDFDFTPQLARGATCQDCHMASSEDPLAKACSFLPDGSRAGNLPVHEFVGANTWIPKMIRDLYAPGIGGGIEDRAADIEQTIERARHMLTQRSAVIETSAQAASGVVNAQVKVTNLAGHKLPTGYAEGRRMWLHVVARDGQGDVVWQTGAWDPATGALGIDAQTRVYEVQQGIWNPATQSCETEDSLGRKQFHFVRNNCVAKDNRIPPLGFTGGADLDTRPVGLVYPPVAPGSPRLVNFDVSSYAIPLPPGFSGQLTVTATLRFQIASAEYITFLRDQAVERNFQPENQMCAGGPGRPFTVGPQGQTRGEFMYDLWSNPAYGRSPPEDMVSASAAVVVAP